jgi:hypothetical protein
MSAKDDPVAEIQGLFLQKDEIGNMLLDNVFGVVGEQIDLAESRIMGASARLSCSPPCVPQWRKCGRRRTERGRLNCKPGAVPSQWCRTSMG